MDFTKREHKPTWLLEYIEHLLKKANEFHNTSFVLYAALETRNLLELIEYSLIFMSLSEQEREKISETAHEKGAVEKFRNEYKTLKYKHLKFFQMVMELSPSLPSAPIGIFNINIIDKYSKEISGSIHIYTKVDNDFIYKGDFVKATFEKIREICDFLRTNFVIEKDGKNYFVTGNLVISSLPPKMKEIYLEWKNEPRQDETILEELKKKIEHSDFVDIWTKKE